jgi:chloramphenicol 3-O-phosphotransferase
MRADIRTARSCTSSPPAPGCPLFESEQYRGSDPAFRSKNASMSGALILIGGPGSGKSSVLDALSTMLEIDQVRFGAIETEQLARGWPWLNAAQWIPQLEAVIELQRRAGRQTFLVAATPETEQELRAVVDAVGVEQVVIVCLSAPADLAAGRVADREPDSWPGKLPLVEHARKLAREIQSLGGIDLVLSTVDQQAAEVATEVKRLLAVKGILRAG